MTEAPTFRYRALGGGSAEEIFTSSVEYFAGDELQFGADRWTVERVEQEGIEHEDGMAVTVRTLYCAIGS